MFIKRDLKDTITHKQLILNQKQNKSAVPLGIFIFFIILQNINAPTLPVYKCDLHLIHAPSGVLIERSINMATNNLSHLSTIAAAVFLPMLAGYWRRSYRPECGH